MRVTVNTTDAMKDTLEKENLIEYLSYYPNLFHDPKLRTKIKEDFISSISTVEITPEENWIEEETKNRVIKEKDGKFKIEYSVTQDSNQTSLSALEQLGQVLLTPKNESPEIYNNCLSKKGSIKIDLTTYEPYGEALTTGFVQVLAKLALLKQQGEGTLREYLTTGKVENMDLEKTWSEEVARLLILATTPPENKDPGAHIAAKLSKEGLESCDSLFIQSNLKNNFATEESYDSYSVKGNFQQFAIIVDTVEERRKEHQYDSNLTEPVLFGLSNYYHHRLLEGQENGSLDIRYQEVLEDLFQENIKGITKLKTVGQEKKANEVEAKVRS